MKVGRKATDFYVDLRVAIREEESKMKHFLIYSVVLVFITGCGGGGSTSNNEVDIITDDSISLNVSTNVLKTSYLPNYDVEDGVFSILKTSEEGNITLLDELSGRYSYIASTQNNDSFIYKISNSHGTSYNIEVNLNFPYIPVISARKEDLFSVFEERI